MRYIKKFKLFENLSDKIDLDELNDVMIDFKQMGLEYDVQFGSSMVINWEKFEQGYLDSYHISDSNFQKNSSNSSLTISFQDRDPMEFNILDTEEGYEMLRDYLFDTYDLIPNYIYINYHWSYLYFKDFDKIKEYKIKNGMGSSGKNTFKAHRLTFGFYEDPEAPFRGSEF